MTKQIREAFTCLSSKDDNNTTSPNLDTSNATNITDTTNTSNNNNDTSQEKNIIENERAIVKGLELSLTPEEEELFQTLENAAIAYERNTLPSNVDHSDEIAMPDPAPERIEIRIAGGWVRDKILNHPSHDVDVALDSLSGLQFASIVQRYLLQQQQQQQQQQTTQTEQGTSRQPTPKPKKPKIAVIAANPNQSKHLETATMNIHSIDVDFVHLRGEVYSSHSRIPTLQQNATPLDDALRRDFTVNSLFYNLRTKHVEDYTGRGIPDLLHSKTLVTPIDANLTFHDDPLRVLRAIRFGVRYGLDLCPEIVQAAKSQEVHDSLHVKVSRERIGKELEGMLSGKNANPKLALMLMADLKLAGCVFSFPPSPFSNTIQGMIRVSSVVAEEEDEHHRNHDYNHTNHAHKEMEYSQFQMDEQGAAHIRQMGWDEAASLLQYTSPLLEAFQARFQNHNNLLDKLNTRLFYLSVFLHPFHSLTYLDKKKKTISLITYMMKESIKFSNKDVNSMTVLMDNMDEVTSILRGYSPTKEKMEIDGNANDDVQSQPQPPQVSSPFCRLRIGMVIRNLKEMWITALLVAAVTELKSNNVHSMDEHKDCYEKEENENENENTHVPITCNNNTIQVFLDLCQDILDHNLEECWKMKPLMDGKAMVQSLELPRGPLVGTYLQEQVKWMLMNPNGSRGECEEHLRAVRKRELSVCSSEGGGNGNKMNEATVKHCKKKAHTG